MFKVASHAGDGLVDVVVVVVAALAVVVVTLVAAVVVAVVVAAVVAAVVDFCFCPFCVRTLCRAPSLCACVEL